jgi:HKD family nuclease
MGPSIQINSNLNYPIGKIINQELQNSVETQIAVAFLKKSGIRRYGIRLLIQL